MEVPVLTEGIDIIETGVIADSDTATGFELGFFPQGQDIVRLSRKIFIRAIPDLLLVIVVKTRLSFYREDLGGDQVIIVIGALAIVEVRRPFLTRLGKSMFEAEHGPMVIEMGGGRRIPFCIGRGGATGQ